MRTPKEEVSHKVAWAAVKQKYKKGEHNWQPKQRN